MPAVKKTNRMPAVTAALAETYGGEAASRAARNLVDLLKPQLKPGYNIADISAEKTRIVVIKNSIGTTPTGEPIIDTVEHRIENPLVQVIRNGGVTQRIIDALGEVWLVPGPGYRGTVHRWVPRDPNAPIQF